MTTQQILYVCGGLLSLLAGILTYLGKKLISQVETAHQSIASLTASLHTNSEETKKLRAEMKTLLRAFTAFDKWVYGEAQLGSFKTPPPDFTNGSEI